jgi:hypothetical protein
VHEPEASVLELEERPVGRDAGDGAVDYRADLDLCDLLPLPLMRAARRDPLDAR